MIKSEKVGKPERECRGRIDNIKEKIVQLLVEERDRKRGGSDCTCIPHNNNSCHTSFGKE